jgi:hypothetical protein
LIAALSLCVGIIIGLTWDKTAINWNSVSQTPTEHPSLTTQPTPSHSIVYLSYNEVSRIKDSKTTQLVLAVNSTLTAGKSVALNFSDFKLDVFVSRSGFIYLPYRYTSVAPVTKGLANLNADVGVVTFRLTFVFPSQGVNPFDGYLTDFCEYKLIYNNTTVDVNWVT